MKLKAIKQKENNLIILSVIIISVIIIGTILALDMYEDSKNEYFYDFEDDDINSFPKDFVKHPRSLAVKVVEWNESDGHFGKVAEIGYFEEIEEKGIELNTLYKKAKSGIVEFDIYVECVINRIYLDLCQEDVIYDKNDDVAIRIWRKDGLDLFVQNKNGILKEALPIRIERWYHFRIEFDVETGWDLNIIYLHNRFSGNYEFFYKPTYFSQVYFGTYRLGTVFYVDNIKITLLELY